VGTPTLETPDQAILASCNILRRLIEAGRREGFSHAYLLESGSSDGAAYFAKAFGLAINCETPRSDDAPACGTCEACRRMALGSFPALVDVWPSGTGVTIGQVKSLIEHASIRYPHGVTKVLLVHAVDRMQIPAANALLKTLEEPPDRTVFILDTASTDQVLPTIRSRCRTATITLPSDAELFPALGIDGSLAETVTLALSVTGRHPRVVTDLFARRKSMVGRTRLAGLDSLFDFLKGALKSYKSADALTPVHALLAGGWYPLHLVEALAHDLDRLSRGPDRYLALSMAAPLARIHEWLVDEAEKCASEKLKGLSELVGAGFHHPQLGGEGKVSLGVARDHVGLVLRAVLTLARQALRSTIDGRSRGDAHDGSTNLSAGRNAEDDPIEPRSKLSDPSAIGFIARHCETLKSYARQNVSADYVFDELFLGISDAFSGDGVPLALGFSTFSPATRGNGDRASNLSSMDLGQGQETD